MPRRSSSAASASSIRRSGAVVWYFVEASVSNQWMRRRTVISGGMAIILRAGVRSAGMRVGIGLPNGIPGTPGETIVEWAARAEAGSFTSLGVIDRVAYD